MNNCSIQANAHLVPHNFNKHKSTVSSMYIIVSKPGSWISKFKRGGMATLNKKSHFFSEVVSSKPIEYNSKSYEKYNADNFCIGKSLPGWHRTLSS